MKAEHYSKRGRNFFWGVGVEQDYSAALQCFKIALDHGNTNILYNVAFGRFFTNGSGGVDIDSQNPEWLYHDVADMGNAQTMFNLGIRYEHGINVDRDPKKAAQFYVQFYKKAVCRLSPPVNAGAKDEPVGCYQDGIVTDKRIQDVKAVHRYRIASNMGSAGAMTNLAVCYENGNGVEKDMEQAVKLYGKAYNMGNTNAMVNLGYCFMSGNGVAHSLQSAILAFTNATKGDKPNIHGYTNLAPF